MPHATPRPLILAAAAALLLAAAPASAVCVGDVDGDGTTGFNDLVALLASWGPCPGCPADLDGDGEVTFDDLVSLLADWDCEVDTGPIIEAELAGRALAGFPHFTPEQLFSAGTTAGGAPLAFSCAVDPATHPELVGATVDLWIVADRDAAEWASDATLVDARGAAQTETLTGPGLADAILALDGPLSGDGGIAFGRGYDLVVDVDRDGTLSGGDLIDGGDGPGFTVFDTFSGDGPLDWSATVYSGGTWLGQVLTWPDDIGTMENVPLVVISHGNGHQYTWYHYLHRLFATRGFVVMSHQNNTGPGIETASTTTLTNTAYLLGNLDTIAGGVLDGHLDRHRIYWIGHSRGGEGVVRAYDRMRDGTWSSPEFELSDIAAITSIAPTVFNSAASGSPGEVPFHFLYGSADGDVHGGADCTQCQAFRIFERATGARAVTYVQGADHNDFNCCGFNDYCVGGGGCSAALAVGRDEAQRVARVALFAMASWIVRGDDAAKEYFARQHENLRDDDVSPATIEDRELRDAPSGIHFVVDDFQTNSSTALSSSGGSVAGSVASWNEGLLDDANSQFTWTASDQMNGMTRVVTGDTSRGTVFEWSANAFLEFELVPAAQDLSGQGFLSFRACQGTRHPSTNGSGGDLDFTVTLRDGSGTTSSIRIGAYGGGIEKPFARSGQGTGSGWANEFETIRIRLADFVADGGALNLSDVVAIRFEFGPSFGHAAGRLGFDDLEILGK